MLGLTMVKAIVFDGAVTLEWALAKYTLDVSYISIFGLIRIMCQYQPNCIPTDSDL